MTLLTDVAAAITATVPAETAVYPSNAEPPTPDNVVTLYSVGGPQGDLDFSGNVQSERTVQVRLRDATQANVQARVEALYTAFQAWRSFTSPSYLMVRASTQPLMVYPKDAQGRSIASFNLRVIRGS
jgi:hypothetical protein